MIIIVPFNRKDKYQHVINCWKNQSIKVPICFVAKDMSVFDNCEKHLDVHWTTGQTSIGAARNAGVEFARTQGHDWVVMWDDDDYYGPKYIEQIYDNIEESVDVLATGIAFVRFDDGLYQFKTPLLFASGHCTAFRVFTAEKFPEWNMSEDVQWSKAMKAKNAIFKRLPPWYLIYNRTGSNHAYDASKAEFMKSFGIAKFIGNVSDSFVDVPCDTSQYPTVEASDEELYASLRARTKKMIEMGTFNGIF